MGKLDEKKQLLIGCGLILLCIVVVNVWLFVSSEHSLQISTSNMPLEENLNSLPATAAGISSVPIAASPDLTQSLPAISAEMAEEIRLLSKPLNEPIASTNPDGSLSVDLNGHHGTVTAVARGENGKLIIRHGGEFLQNVEPK